MDLEDMAVEVVEVLPAPPEDVFALLSDVERMAGLGPEHTSARWAGDARGVGARFDGTNAREGMGTWTVPCWVVEHEPPRRFAWTTGNPDLPSARWSYALEPVEGGTQVRQRFRLGPGNSYLRQVCEQRPDRAQQYVAGRAAQVEANMRAVLRAAADLLG